MLLYRHLKPNGETFYVGVGNNIRPQFNFKELPLPNDPEINKVYEFMKNIKNNEKY